jgi:hypothetical protein
MVLICSDLAGFFEDAIGMPHQDTRLQHPARCSFEPGMDKVCIFNILKAQPLALGNGANLCKQAGKVVTVPQISNMAQIESTKRMVVPILHC